MRRWLVAVAVLSVLAAGCSDDDEVEGLQLRPVIGAAEHCEEYPHNPPAVEPASMSSGGKCVGLAPSVLTITKAEVRESRDAESGALYAMVELAGDDVKRLAEVSRQFVGKEVAMVVFGRIVNAPVFAEPILDGELQIVGLSSDDITQLEKALD